MAEEYRAGFREAITQPFPPFPRDLEDKYFNAGLAYFDSFAGFEDGWEIVDSEKKFSVDIGGYQVVGIIDLIMKNPETGEFMVIDHKSKSLTSMRKELDTFLMQLYLYAMYIKETYGVWPSILRFNMFKEGCNIDEPFREAMVEETKKWVLDTIHKIEQTTDFEVSQSSYFCRWICSALDACPARDSILNAR